ncbi:HlyD family secretion protein [Martelella mangrovi]|uniref:Membrane fusion protein (Multidrug efflux system) n=1 Tax=Martelella mangrovi TaxID=1397477 RepID=A0ABV2IBC9_9HYPH
MSFAKPKIVVPVVALLLLGAGYYVNRAEADSRHQSTNDAYLEADYTNVAPEVSGRVARLLVAENQKVEKGDLLAVLDDHDLTLEVNAAKAALAAAEAAQATLAAQITQQHSLIAAAQSSLDADDAALILAESKEKRARDMAERGTGTQAVLDEMVSSLASVKARRAADSANLAAQRQQLDIYAGQQKSALAAVQQAQAALDLAELRLSYAEIKAPVSGTIGQQNLRIGDYVTTGSTAMSIVPLSEIYVTANFRETQLAHVRAGQPVTLSVDAIPGREFSGTVASLGPASNVSYSAVAPANATGNFTKVAQRLPVRIEIAPGQPQMDLMRAGMSVIADIDTDITPESKS